MSSHREAPEISKDPVADSTDLYAFVTPKSPKTMTIIANYIPLQPPAGGPNFSEFADDVSYRINIDNNHDAIADIVYEFRFTTRVRDKNTFLYNTGPIGSIGSKNWNRPQFYSVHRHLYEHGKQVATRELASDLAVPPVNIGPRSTPDYDATFTSAAVHDLGAVKVFAGQRADAFHVDLGSVFDLGTLRPFENLHLIPSAAAMGVNGVQGFNVHSIALHLPIAAVTRNHAIPKHERDPRASIGIWTSAHRRASRIYQNGRSVSHGDWVQVSRLGNPLFNEVVVPMAEKDRWNSLTPDKDAKFLKYVEHPELGALLPVLYPGVFPNLAAYTKPRIDLVAALLNGIPSGIVKGLTTFTGNTVADMLRLNVAVPPSSSPSPYGVLGGDLAGFPNGRRIDDDVVAIELRAVAGATIPLVDPSYTPDNAAGLLQDGTSNTNPPLRHSFPFLGPPAGGYQTMPATPVSS